MNKVVAWLKSNVLIVVFGVLILALPVAGYFGASNWNKKIKAEAEERLTSSKRKVDAVKTVTYTLPAVAEGEAPLQESRAPNAAVTAFFAKQRAERQEAIEAVVTSAVRFNKTEDRELLMPGVLPSAGEGRAVRQNVKALAELIVGTDDRPSVYAGLFREINAGAPMSKADVARRVVDAYRAEVDQAGGDLGSLSEDEQIALDERMKGQRYGVYARRAEELSVYGSVEALYGADPAVDSVIPQEVPTQSEDESAALRYQMDYWLVEDLLRGIDLANRTDDGLPTEVPRSPVKRIVSVRLSQMDIPEKPEDGGAGSSSASSSGGGAASPGGFGSPGGGRGALSMGSSPMNPMNPMGGMGAGGGGAGSDDTHTGRKADDKNGVYLVRHATVSLVCASDDLVRVLESFGEANFMTVTGVSLSEVDRWADLAEGYYYGPDHVVRAEIEIEAAYLHFWLADVVPGYVAAEWGIELPAAEANAVP